jgi:hypothetical protein
MIAGEERSMVGAHSKLEDRQTDTGEGSCSSSDRGVVCFFPCWIFTF